MMRFMSKASMLAILTCLEDADENADDSAMETGIWCKQNWMCFLTCRVFNVCVMKIGFMIVLQHVTSTVGNMHIKSCLLVDSLWLCC